MKSWKLLSLLVQNAFLLSSASLAHSMLAGRSFADEGPAILGFPPSELFTDYNVSSMLQQHVLVGEVLAQAALQSEILICEVSGVKNLKLYLGRSQFPTFKFEPVVRVSSGNFLEPLQKQNDGVHAYSY